MFGAVDFLESWDCGNCWPQYPPARVRMQNYDQQANATWNTLLGYMKNIPENGIAGDPVGRWATAMEGAGGIGTINELLLQSHTGTLELFPQVPPGEPASFKNLRARGGFVSTGNRHHLAIHVGLQSCYIITRWSTVIVAFACAHICHTRTVYAQLVMANMASGYRKEIDGVKIFSEAGRQVALQSPWDCVDIKVVANPGGVVATQREGDSVAWSTQPGVSYDVACAGLFN